MVGSRSRSAELAHPSVRPRGNYGGCEPTIAYSPWLRRSRLAGAIGFCSLAEVLDTTTPAGRLLFAILASLAAFERDLVVERTNAGLAAARPGPGRWAAADDDPAQAPGGPAAARRRAVQDPCRRHDRVSRPTLYKHLHRSAP